MKYPATLMRYLANELSAGDWDLDTLCESTLAEALTMDELRELVEKPEVMREFVEALSGLADHYEAQNAQEAGDGR